MNKEEDHIKYPGLEAQVKRFSPFPGERAEILFKIAYKIGYDSKDIKVHKYTDQLELNFGEVAYEILIDDDENTPFQMNTWIPISFDSIKDPSRIEEYIERGLLREKLV